MALDHHRGGFGAPLVFIHGIGHTWRGWKPMLPLLEERFDVLAVDMPGFGHSEPFPPGVDSTAEALADAVEDEMGGPASTGRTSPATHSAAGSRSSWRDAGARRPSRRSRRRGSSTAGRGPGRGHPPELALVGAKRPAAGVPGPEPGRPGHSPENCRQKEFHNRRACSGGKESTIC